MAEVEFLDFSDKVIGAMDEALIAALQAGADEMTSQVMDLTEMGRNKNDGYDVRASWKNQVDEAKKTARVGSPLEAAYWEEFGTGEYALNKDGRKGWWVYIEGGSGYHGTTNKYSSREEAESMAEYIRSKYGLPAVATNGRKPNRPLHRAFTEKKNLVIGIIEDEIKGGMA